MKVKPVILCGGVGKRLNPISTNKNPKQFLKIFEDKSLFELTLARILDKNIFLDPLIVTNKKFEKKIKKELRAKKTKGKILLEKTPKNTLFATIFAALESETQDLLLIMPSDHIIENTKVFEDVVKNLINENLEDKFVLFGNKTEKFSSNYGYFICQSSDERLKTIKSFIEKPNLLTFTKSIEPFNYFVNCGIFLFKAGFFLSICKKLVPEVLEVCTKAFNSSKQVNYCRIIDNELKDFPSVSIDFGLIEKMESLYAVEFKTSWADVGNMINFISQVPPESVAKILVSN